MVLFPLQASPTWCATRNQLEGNGNESIEGSSSSTAPAPSAGTPRTGSPPLESEKKANFLGGTETSFKESFLLGSFTGFTCVMVGYPFDTVKVRLQSGQFSIKNRAGLFSNLYRGVSAPLMAVIPCWICAFTFYGMALNALGDDSLASCAIAGAVSGASYSVIICPFEFAKVNTQVQKNRSIGSVTRELVRRFGLPVMYRGYAACFVRDAGQNGMYYFCAEYFNRALTEPLGENMAALVAGGLTGVAHCTIEFPFDTVKTRKQSIVAPAIAGMSTGMSACVEGNSRATCANGNATVTNGARTLAKEVGIPALRVGDMSISYNNIIKAITTDVAGMKSLRAAYAVTITRAIIAHSASFGVLQQVKPYFLNQ